MLVIRDIRPAGQSAFAESKDDQKFLKDHMVVLELVKKVEGVDADEALIIQSDVTASTYVKTVRMDNLTEKVIDANGVADCAKMLENMKQKWINKELKSFFGFDIPVSEITNNEHNTIVFAYAPKGQNEAQSRHIVGIGKNEDAARQSAIADEKARLVRAVDAGIIELTNKGV